ncbi:MAG: choice-of-anchor B family protein [Gemmatimonadaceae bacterium]
MILSKMLAVLIAGSGLSAALAAPAKPKPSAKTPAKVGVAKDAKVVSATKWRSAISNEVFSAYGRSVAIAGEFAFVGEPSVGGNGRGGGGGRGGVAAAGVVHVYRQGTAGWKPSGELTSANSSGGDGFGVVMAAEGVTLLVGQVRPAPQANVGRGGPPPAGGGRGAQTPPAPPPPDTAVGTVQMFKRGADMKWSAGGTLEGSKAGGSQFGAALALAGDVAMVGAPGEPNGGSVYVYNRAKDGTWALNVTLPVQGIVTGDHFGAAIAIDGNRVAVGAPSRKAKGALFIFRKEPNGSWVQETEQVAPANVPVGAQFGAAVAVKGDRVIVGAPATNFLIPPTAVIRDSLMNVISSAVGLARDEAVNRLVALAGGNIAPGVQLRGTPSIQSGLVVAFERASFGSWRIVSTLAPFDYGNVNFGAALSVVGNELWIGAPGSDGAGRIYRATADKDGGWSGMKKLGVDTIEAGAQWAASFAVSGANAIIGMPGDGGGGGTVAFMGKNATGDWSLRAMNMPPVAERYPTVLGKEIKCGADGMASSFECSKMDLQSFMPISAVGGKRGVSLSGSWGWTDPVTGHDIAILGRTDAAAFVDVTDPVHPKYLGDLMRTKGANMSSWREIKTYKNYALIVSDGSGDHHGIQIFDLTHLRGVTTPRRFVEDAHFDAGSIHDIAVNNESGFAYAVGTASGGERCSGGLLMINMKSPLKPEFAGCFADVGTGRSRGGYTHDVLCVNYKGPDKRYVGHEICMASNETTVSIQDVTDKKNVKVLSHADYPTPGYTHQGWFTEDQRYFFMDDELDETSGLGRSVEGTRTLIFDVADLEQPIMKKEYIGPTKASDHNLYIKGDRIYQSNYKAGLRILDISDPLNPKEIGFMDTQPGENSPGFSGSWNNYPFFKNGSIGISSIGEGFFMVKDVPRKIVP